MIEKITKLCKLPLPLPKDFPAYDSSNYFKFEVIHQSKKSNARVTRITTPNGIINQPNFVPVGTIGSIKFLDPVHTKETKSQLMFVNTYHMIVNSDPDLIEKAGGLHKFINYQNPIITDSGGFQVFSMGHPELNNINNNNNIKEKPINLISELDELDIEIDVKDTKQINSIELTKRELKGAGGKQYPGSIEAITDEGVIFRSYKNGNKIQLGPKTSVQYQKKLGADIIIPFDELPPYHMDENKILESLQRTHHWEAISLMEHIKDPRKQAMYCVMHGGVNVDMRLESIRYLTSLPFDGVAIGGSVGKDREEMKHLLSKIMQHMPKDKPNHLLGIGDLESIESSIPLGIDSFDSSYPTRLARHGRILLSTGESYLIKKDENKFKFNESLEKNCDCHTCKNYSTAYIYHLFKSNEQIYFTLSTQHNLRVMNKIMENYRNKILADEI